MAWTLRRILIVIVILSSLAVAGTLHWVTATHQRFAIDNQHEITAATVSHLVRQQLLDRHQRKVNPFIDEWSRLSTLVQGMREGSAEKARFAANRMMLTLEVAEGRIRLRNVVVYSKDMQVVAAADKGTGESLSALPELINRLSVRDVSEQRRITSFLWRGSDGRPLYSTVAPIGGFQLAGFIEFVTDPVPDLAGISDAFQGRFRLLDIHGDTLFDGGDAASDAPEPESDNRDTLRVPISDALDGTWAVATLTRDLSAFQATVSRLRGQAFAIVAAVILGSVLIGWLLLRFAVFQRVKAFAAVMEQLAEGNTDVEFPSVGPDEFSKMRASLESLRNAVKDREEATVALRESEGRVRAIIDNSPNAIYLKDTEGRYTMVNAAVAKRQGFDPKDMIGVTAYDHFPKEIADAITEQENEVFKTGKVSEQELDITTKESGPRVGLMVKFPVHDAHGVVTGVGTITTDITERIRSEQELLAAREKAEEQAQLQRIILENIGQGILVFNKDARLALWNDQAIRFTGVPNAFLAEKRSWNDYEQFMADKNAFDGYVLDRIAEFDRRINDGERDFVIAYQRRGIEGDSWVQVNLRSLSDGMRVQTYQDITKLHDAVDAAQEAQHLAEDANRAKSDFLSNMSHELRTPLNAIIGFTEFVVEDDQDPLSDDQKSSLSQVLKAGRHLLLLINDVLDLSKIEAGAITLSLEPVDAGQVVDECVSLTASFAAGRNVTVHNSLTADLPPIKADRIRFKQVFLNLLTNAIKYNNDPGSVYIRQDPAPPGTLRIGVCDTGPGIPEDGLKNLFDPFERLGAENSAVEGTGIGLTITKNLVDQMDGKITVESVVGEGSTFRLDMPFSDRPAERHPLADKLDETVATDIEGLILYVEDNPANLELVRKILSRQPAVDFIDAPTGQLGIERARELSPDVILLDINLPDLDGYQVLEILRVMPETRNIPVIALTAAATEADIRKGQAAGFFSYLTKPITARDLVATIGRALRPSGSDAADHEAIGMTGTVLVVDDLPINLVITLKQLSKLGIRGEAVDDPVAALEMLKSGAYALALVDVGMPVLNGLELTRRLRRYEQESGTYTPVVALTASYGSEEDFSRYREAGMDGQLSKPVALKDLASTLHRWFSAGNQAAGQEARPMPSRAAPAVDLPPLDLDEFIEILGTDDAQTVREMFDLFIELIPGEMDNLSNAVAARDKVQSREAAHRFKSAARNVAAGGLSDLLEKMEREASEGVWETLDTDLQRVRDECARVREYMQADA